MLKMLRNCHSECLPARRVHEFLNTQERALSLPHPFIGDIRRNSVLVEPYKQLHPTECIMKAAPPEIHPIYCVCLGNCDISVTDGKCTNRSATRDHPEDTCAMASAYESGAHGNHTKNSNQKNVHRRQHPQKSTPFIVLFTNCDSSCKRQQMTHQICYVGSPRSPYVGSPRTPR